ncbi:MULTISPECIES: cation diffusion facilitator family transporter [Mameliella]|uniref:cation diffusion facilitator family transporter n=1 Tax=Mameliella TaxID=1434019 RepID=UPI0008410B1F|nr:MULTISPECIES: cation diffusion facilitator family transporter [Mameliella]MCR9276280.1 cation diffusion facilitator family transporter [Paracoccaceae bacterium]ODM48542.1 cadmium transporter [Ruegeria sp. PBVC088]MBY6118990.1 cation diffusion facilitator family transporter [Mameliella alba]MDD9732138.1 cation diffusion facilitator family transporter [Mameliella sp. AT18]OWV43906.1 cation transporter [Mameliella alba]
MPRAVKIALGSIAVGVAVLAIKLLAWWLTGSVALLSDALESIVNVATAIAAFVAVRIAVQPADADHPFGHHKAEYFSAVMEGVMIVVAAILILNEAWGAWNAPRDIDAPFTGLVLIGLASVINGIWAVVLMREGRSLRSPALEADGRHLMTDVVSSAGVAIGVVAAVLTGALWLDALLAALVAVNILWSGWQVLRGSVGGLMDESVPEDDLEAMRELISANAEGAVEAHDLRARHAGQATFVEFHLVVPGEMSVDTAHDICDRIEAAMMAAFDGCRVTIHVEPEHKAKHSGIVVL